MKDSSAAGNFRLCVGEYVYLYMKMTVGFGGRVQEYRVRRNSYFWLQLLFVVFEMELCMSEMDHVRG